MGYAGDVTVLLNDGKQAAAVWSVLDDGRGAAFFPAGGPMPVTLETLTVIWGLQRDTLAAVPLALSVGEAGTLVLVELL